VESHGPINRDALQFLSELGSWRLVETTGDVRASSFLFQRISVAVQQFNSAPLHDGFIDNDRPELGALPNNMYPLCQFLIHQRFSPGKNKTNNNDINDVIICTAPRSRKYGGADGSVILNRLTGVQTIRVFKFRF